MEKNLLSVSDFIALTNQTLEYAYPSVAIEGEVSEFKVSQGKWVYFKLKDDTATIDCFMTLWQLRVAIEDGMKVVVLASPKLTTWGRFSLTVKSIKPSGEGAIKKSFELLKAKLDKEGLFSPERKRALPYTPSHIAVISSTAAAGYADFIKILNDRWGGVKVDVAHVQVQGDVAPDQIIRALEYLNTRDELPEVVVIIRGGGSADDLSAFNDEKLVRAVAGSRIPTLVGVGHEVDESLCDLAADVSASTPSNAAQILVPDKADLIKSINYKIKALIPKLSSIFAQEVDQVRTSLDGIFEVFDSKIDRQIELVSRIGGTLRQLNPETVLARGYALLRGAVKIGETIEIETKSNIIKAEVKDVKTR